ncbi:MAG: RHS repeat-associated core domain-containing protein [Brevundimonas sp.]|uniref:RHS repeat-associated core domain-containing protein n=1 Tax=Brevundimonas sp. TaxID=1871086 RepID=UPI00300208C6
MDGLNRVTQAGSTSVTYDTRGNITAGPGGSYGYDTQNNLTSAGGATFTFDPLNRLERAAGTATTRFLYDGLQVVGEYPATGSTPSTRYVPGVGLDDVVVSYAGSGTSTRIWLLADERQSVIGLVDGSGAASVQAYDEYGVRAGAYTSRFQYTGQMWLPDAGLYHYRARAYDPNLGRFLQTDPIGYAAGANLYAYVGGDPVNLTDPLGLDPDAPPTTRVDEIIVIGPQDPCAQIGGCLTLAQLQEWVERTLPGYTICRPQRFRITGIGPTQAPGTTAISFQPRAEIPRNGVAINPAQFGVRLRGNPAEAGTVRNVLGRVVLYPVWREAERPSNNAPAVPPGLPTAGWLRPVDSISPVPSELSIDVYGYTSQSQAYASTRYLDVVVAIPPNSAGVRCPAGSN